jgi:hypothetical protein
MKKITVAMLAVLISFCLSACIPFGVLFNAVASSEDTGSAAKTDGKIQRLQSEDGKFSAVIPQGWKEMDDLHDDAELAMGASHRERYMIALIESKIDLEYSFDECMEITRGTTLDNVENDQLSEPVELSVNGCPAIQYVLSGTVDKLNITYLLTYIDGENNYGQIICWSLKSEYKDAEAEFEQITQSIKGV